MTCEIFLHSTRSWADDTDVPWEFVAWHWYIPSSRVLSKRLITKTFPLTCTSPGVLVRTVEFCIAHIQNHNTMCKEQIVVNILAGKLICLTRYFFIANTFINVFYTKSIRTQWRRSCICSRRRTVHVIWQGTRCQTRFSLTSCVWLSVK